MVRGSNPRLPTTIILILDSMKERIVVEYGEVNKIAELMGCTNVMVSHALAFRKNSKLARSIRKLAIERGGSKVGGNPQNTSSHEK